MNIVEGIAAFVAVWVVFSLVYMWPLIKEKYNNRKKNNK